MIESQYTSALHKKLPPHIYKWKINDNFAGGVPDAFYRTLKVVPTRPNWTAKPLWVEYKFLKALPALDETKIIPKLSAQQLIWLEQAYKAGEQTLVIIGVESERINRQTAGFLMYHHEWREGITRAEAQKRLRSMDDIAVTMAHLCDYIS